MMKVVEQMCSSLAEAHQQGIVHRDLKPENIYLEPRPGDPEFVKILDFGIAKIVSGEIGSQSPQLTATGQTLGTLEYMSPEQLMGKQLDGRSDVYAVGVVAYELLTGRLPFPDAQGPAALIAAQLKKTPVAPSVARPDAGIPAGVDALILRMLEKDKNKRFADVNELAAACREVITSGGVLSGAAASAPMPVAVAAPQQAAQQVLPQAPARPLTPPPLVQSPPAPGPMPSGPESQAASRLGVGPATQQVINETSSKLWLWILLGIAAVGGVIGIIVAAT
jgi:serine/threonine-protein kinase